MSSEDYTLYVISLGINHNTAIKHFASVNGEDEEELITGIIVEWIEGKDSSQTELNILDELKGINARLEWIEGQVANVDLTDVEPA